MPLVGALIAKEFQTWLQGRVTFVLFSALVFGVTVLVLLLGLVILAPDANAAPALGTSSSSTAAGNFVVQNRGLMLFGAVGACLLVAAALVAPAVAASLVAVERERGTLDLLLLQAGGAGRLVVAKLLAGLLFSLLVLVVGVPLFAPAWSFGGIRPDHVGAMTAVLLTSTLVFSAAGVLCGAVLRGGLPAALFAQAAALALLFGLPGLVIMLAQTGGSADALRPLLWLNPFLAMLSGGDSITEAFARQAPVAYRSVLALPAASPLPGLTLPAWVVASVLWILLSGALAYAAAVALDPCHPLKLRRRGPV